MTGFALAPEREQDLFEVANVRSALHRHEIGDVRDLDRLVACMRAAEPEIVIHMAAQSLVRLSYDEPVDLCDQRDGHGQCARSRAACSWVRAVVIVTSDKCYENTGWAGAIARTIGSAATTPTATARAAPKLSTAAYRRSFFRRRRLCQVASARAGNVIGGGDWARDRLVPDTMRAFMAGTVAPHTQPGRGASLAACARSDIGYLLLAQRLGRVAADMPKAGISARAASEVPVSASSPWSASWGATAHAGNWMPLTIRTRPPTSSSIAARRSASWTGSPFSI